MTVSGPIGAADGAVSLESMGRPRVRTTVLNRFNLEERKTLQRLGKLLAALQGFAGMTMFAAGIGALVVAVAAAAALQETDEPLARVLAITGLALSPMLLACAVMLFRSATKLVAAVREGSEVMRGRLRRTVLASLPMALASAGVVGVCAWAAGSGDVAAGVIVLVYLGPLVLAMSIVPALSLWLLLRHGAFIDDVLREPIPRAGTRTDALDQFLIDAKRSVKSKKRKPAHDGLAVEGEVRVTEDDPLRGDVAALIAAHLEHMHAHSPACKAHAMPAEALRAPGITLYTVRDVMTDELLGCGALKELRGGAAGEIKSMRTAAPHLRRGVGRLLVQHLIAEATRRGYAHLHLETGSGEVFEPAHHLYRQAGFAPGDPFEGYEANEFSRFMTKALRPA